VEISSTKPNGHGPDLGDLSDELYDGPVPGPRFAMMPEPPTPARQTPAYVGALTAAIDVISARLLGLLAVTGAVAMWGYAVYDPIPVRTMAAGGFSITVLLPLVILYWRRG